MGAVRLTRGATMLAHDSMIQKEDRSVFVGMVETIESSNVEQHSIEWCCSIEAS
jgi:hypothetical protein